MRRSLLPLAFLVCLPVLTSGCAGTGEMLGAAYDYQDAPLANTRATLDLPYWEGPQAHPDKHRLDLYLPPIDGFPTLVFVHGGGWTAGDRAMGGLGIEPIRNVGRFLAARGIGVATLSYRLQPGATWQEQVDDVARATTFAAREVAARGGDANALYLGGHSAGAWLSAWVGLTDGPLAAHGFARERLCGVVLISGAGYDLTDEETWELGASRAYFEDLFGRDAQPWAEAASPRLHLAPVLAPVLVMTAGGEPPKFQRQSDVLHTAVLERGGVSQRIVVPGQNHQRILIGLSLDRDPVSQATLDFFREADCPAKAR